MTNSFKVFIFFYILINYIFYLPLSLVEGLEPISACLGKDRVTLDKLPVHCKGHI